MSDNDFIFNIFNRSPTHILTDKNIKKFEQLFRELFNPLCSFSMKYVHDLDEAKNIVHEVFISVWEKFDSLPEDVNYRSYFYTSVRNRCLNQIRNKKKTVLFENVAEQVLPKEYNHTLENEELEREIELAINSLPEKCRQVFELSRFEGLKYAQIAEKMAEPGSMVLGIEREVSANLDRIITLLKNH